jgi:hypothetical protein
MAGAQLNPSTPNCNSPVCQDLIFQASTSNSSSSTPKKKELILMVDVINEGGVPEIVRNKAMRIKATIPKRHPLDYRTGYLDRMGYCYRLLSLYANQAKVVITSRIHVGLPAVALGIPVIFVEHGDWLPGGKKSVGRVAGLLDVFHQVDIPNGKNWTFGDLSGDVPLSQGTHLADRYRASFWNRLKKTSSFYADAATLFGMIPMQRLGRQLDPSGDVLHSAFHFVLETEEIETMAWPTKRAIEHILYFHPNARLHVHTGTRSPIGFLETLSEAGYDIVIHPFDPKDLAGKPFWHRFEGKDGGVYVSKHTHITEAIPKHISSGVVMDQLGEVVMIISEQWGFESVDDFPKLHATVLGASETKRCMEDPSWNVPKSLTLVVDSSAKDYTLVLNSPCFQQMDEVCIFCDDVNWEFPSLEAPPPLLQRQK